MLGKSDQALEVIEESKRLSKQRYVPSYSLALIYTGLDERDAALAYLEKTFEERWRAVPFLGAEPALDALHSDPRFQDLVRRLNLPE